MKKLQTSRTIGRPLALACSGLLALGLTLATPPATPAAPAGGAYMSHHHLYDDGAYTGRVTLVSTSMSFNIDISGRIYDVYTVDPLPPELSAGDFVRVFGDREGSAKIVNASVQVLDDN